MSILVITTGGTIGAEAYDNPQNPPQCVTMPMDGKDIVSEALKQPVFAFAKTRCVSMEPRDSKLIDESYLQQIIDQITAAPESGILITYGTDRILQAASYFYYQASENPALRNKIIMLTGAMVPLANGAGTDGYLNLKYSLEQIIELATVSDIRPQHRSGVYIVLCDYEQPETESGAWKPKLYPYQPDQYEKVYASDGRYNRLRRA